MSVVNVKVVIILTFTIVIALLVIDRDFFLRAAIEHTPLFLFLTLVLLSHSQHLYRCVFGLFDLEGRLVVVFGGRTFVR